MDKGSTLANRKERAINLGLKIKSLKNNAAVAKAAVAELEKEITSADIEPADKEALLTLYKSILDEREKYKSPSVIQRDEFRDKIDVLFMNVRDMKEYSEADSLEGRIIALQESLEKASVKKEHRASLKPKLKLLEEKFKNKKNYLLTCNFRKAEKLIKSETRKNNPFLVTEAIKELNKKIRLIPLFSSDRSKLQAMLDTLWQKASKDIDAEKARQKDKEVSDK